MTKQNAIIKRLEQFIEESGKNQAEVAKLIGLLPQSLNRTIRLRRPLSSGLLLSLESKMNLNVDWLINGTGEMIRKGHTHLKQIEDEANAFAAALLMPKDKVIAFWEEYKDCSQIAHRFGVSSIAVYCRLKNLGIIKE